MVATPLLSVLAVYTLPPNLNLMVLPTIAFPSDHFKIAEYAVVLADCLTLTDLAYNVDLTVIELITLYP